MIDRYIRLTYLLTEAPERCRWSRGGVKYREKRL